MSGPGGGSASSNGCTTRSPQVPATQLPARQRFGELHGELHEPQWIGSLERSTHVPLQYVPVGQDAMQLPLAHACPFPQRMLQPPQFVESKRQSTQRPSQYTVSGGHEIWQVPFRHSTPSPKHGIPQSPQLNGSDDGSTHAPLQTAPSQASTQRPPEQN